MREAPAHVDAYRPAGLDPSYLPVLPVEGQPHGLSVVGDSVGEVFVAWTSYQAAAEDGGALQGRLHFAAFDVDAGAWLRPRAAVVVGDTSRLEPPLALARDTSTGALGLAYVNRGPEGQHVDLAVSTDLGQSWTTSQLSSEAPDAGADAPALALAGGQAHVAYRTAEGIEYRHGSEADPAAAWPAPVPLRSAEPGPPVLALARDGEPRLALRERGGLVEARPQADGGLLGRLRTEAPTDGGLPPPLPEASLAARAWTSGRLQVARSVGGRLGAVWEARPPAAACAQEGGAWSPCGPDAGAIEAQELVPAFAGEKLLLTGYVAPTPQRSGGIFVWREP